MRLFGDLQRANVTVYAYDAHGLEVDGSMVAKESLYSFAESTGGRAVAFTNDPESFVADAFRESSTYYFIGFRTTASNEKEFHKIEVKVIVRALQVHTRNGYYPPRRTRVRRRSTAFRAAICRSIRQWRPLPYQDAAKPK